MPDLYLVFSHELSESQKKEAYERLGVKDILGLPDNLKAIWSQIPADIPCVSEYIEPVREWLEKNIREGDYILIQGDFGATYLLVKWAFSKNCTPLYATTERIVTETHNGEKVIVSRVFEHVRFRFYEQD
ncbi:MAG TPA: hypothetical protein GXX14_07465 [Clostridiaceae bacterium]|nr:hypothetical protein [Clostridiaceae bacterium]